MRVDNNCKSRTRRGEMTTKITILKDKMREKQREKSTAARRLACERAYGKSLADCKTNDDINAWMLREDCYLAEMLAE